MKRQLLPIVLLSAALVLGGCSTNDASDGDNSSSSSPAVSTPTRHSSDLTIKVTGSCSERGGLRLRSSGLTPNGRYRTEAWYPNGVPYTYLLNGGEGTADPSGRASAWRWDCQHGANGKPDPSGTYRLVVTDLSTGRSATTSFRVRY